MIEISDLQAGKVGEYLVCADLILKGYTAFLSEQGLSYDVVLDIDGRLLRIQVKSTREPKSVPQRKDYTPAYLFNIRRMGAKGRGSYSSDDVDIFALVALDRKIIGYLPEDKAKQTMIFRIKDYDGMYSDEKNVDRRKKILELRENGVSFREIGRQLEIDPAQASRIEKGEGTKKKYTYLEDLSFDKALLGL